MESIENGAANQVVVKVVGSILEVDSAKWDTLALNMPLLSHAFLSALEKSNSVGAASGWSPCILTIQQEENLLGAM
ncbi:MAG TPA: peptidogalycan biosysnthesis protein, partial [Methylophilaceae bacterium]|nr:peptidogalycan biosysnthesis protein [Methylophilaceae bacterium]